MISVYLLKTSLMKRNPFRLLALLLLLVAGCTQAYPDSRRLNDYFASHRTELADYYKRLDQADTTQIYWVARADSMRTFAQVLASFKGKPLFVDFWFSTCSPCLEEMKESGPLKAFLKQRGIELLYISIDRPERDLNWRNAIKYHQLYGHHLRTSKPLHEDIYQNYGINLFPTYMLVDAAGNIVIPRAKNPSEGQALLDQIEAVL